MADKTFGVKVSEEMYEKAKLVIEASGVSSKDWFEKAVALYEVNSIKQGSSDYTQDLTELEHHTTRMYELIVNMIQRSVYLKDHAVKDISDKLDSKEAIITDFQQQMQNLKAEVNEKNNVVVVLQHREKELEDKLKANETMLENNQALIAEYKEKNDTLNGLVTKYQSYSEENEQLKIELDEVKATLTGRAIDAELKVDLLTRNLAESGAALQKAQQEHEDGLYMAIERKDLEREKALVEIERQQQAQMAALNEQHNEQIRELYAEIAELRKTNEGNREKFLTEIETLKKKQKDN